VLYVNFENLTETLKKNARTLELAFTFPIKLPAFYRQNNDMKDILKKMLMEKKKEAKGQSETKTMQPSQSVAHGMDPKFFKSEAVDNSKFDDKDK